MTRRAPNILFIAPHLRIGGAERMVLNVLPALKRGGFDVAFFCIGAPGEFFDDLVEAGVHAVSLNLRGKRKAGRAMWRLVSEIRRAQPDIVITQFLGANVLGILASTILGVRHRVVWVHSQDGFTAAGFFGRLFNRFSRKWIDSYFVVNRELESHLATRAGIPPPKIRTLYNGVDPAEFQTDMDRTVLRELGIHDDAPVVGIVGRLVPVKNHASFLLSAQRVLARVPSAQFLVIGDGDLRRSLEVQCAQQQIASSVHFLGIRKDIARILQGIDVLVLSSHSEGFPFAILEGMAAARPVVCTDVGGLAEMVEDSLTGFLVPPDDVRALADRQIELLLNPVLARKMGMAGRRRIESQLTLGAAVAAIEKALCEIAGSAATEDQL